MTAGQAGKAGFRAVWEPRVSLRLRDSVKLSGRGLHSGEKASVIIHPAPEDAGILFFDGKHTISGLASNVVDTSRGTTLGFNGNRIGTIEHLMAALRGMGVDNAVVEVSGCETPALDGSALPYVEAMEAVGLVVQDASRRTIKLRAACLCAGQMARLFWLCRRTI